jgi:4-hydroxybenzoate polyprenyltransferase
MTTTLLARLHALWNLARLGAVAAPAPAASRGPSGSPGAGAWPPPGRPARATLRAIAQAMRPGQWVKNLLVFVPLLLADRLFELAALALAIQAFVAFSLCASAAYVLNDLLDVEADRRHPYKRRRPFAAGTLSVRHGLCIIGVALAAAAAVATALPGPFSAALAAYVASTTLYSLVLKRLVVVDIFVLALLFALRVFAGGLAVGVEISAWLLALSLFLFQSLATLKRHAELGLAGTAADLGLAGRAYTSRDRPCLGIVGLLSGYLSALVLALYISTDAVERHYTRPEMLWPACLLLLFWMTRLWLRAYRDEVTDDSVGVVLADRSTYAVAFGMVAALVLAR